MIKSIFLLGAGFMLALGFATAAYEGYQVGQNSVVAQCYRYFEFTISGTEFMKCYPGKEIEIVEGSKKGKKR